MHHGLVLMSTKPWISVGIEWWFFIVVRPAIYLLASEGYRQYHISTANKRYDVYTIIAKWRSLISTIYLLIDLYNEKKNVVAVMEEPGVYPSIYDVIESKPERAKSIPYFQFFDHELHREVLIVTLLFSFLLLTKWFFCLISSCFEIFW